MQKLSALVLSFGAVFVWGCSGSDPAPNTPDAGAPAGPSCNLPSCLQALGTACVPAGTCKTDESVGGTLTVCYANGLRYANTLTSGSYSINVSNGSTSCYTGTGTLTGTSFVVPLKNQAGATIATLTQDVSSGATTVTCSGGSPVQLSTACWNGDGCDLGVCP